MSILKEGLLLNVYKFNLLAYADDVVFMVDRPSVLQHMINGLVKYCDRLRLIVNLAKSKIIVFRKIGKLAKM